MAMRSTSPLAYHLIRRVQAMKAGGPEVLAINDLPIADIKLKPTEVLIRASYAGVNFIDTYYRNGLYKKAPEQGGGENDGFPLGIGEEGSGAIIQVGTDIGRNDWLNKRVAYFKNLSGSYASFVVADVSQVFPLPEKVNDRFGAAILLQGCTAHYLTHDSYPVNKGDVVLVHAAAGGTGLLIGQMAKHRGARLVIGVCGGQEKANLAREVGKCDIVIDYKDPAIGNNWHEEVRKVCPEGVNVVYDGVGASTFQGSLKTLRPRGYMITFGNASGPVPPFSPLELTKLGSLYVQRPSLNSYMLTREESETRIAEVMNLVQKGIVSIAIGGIYKLDDVEKCHRDLEGRQTIGKLLINCQE